MNIIRNIIGLFIIGYLIALIYLNVNVPKNNQNVKLDVLIVLGAKVKKEEPTRLLRERLDTAIAYYKRHPQVNIVVSGGQGRDETHPEAEVMQQYLINHNVPKAQLYMEKQSTNTCQNLRNSKAIIDKHHLGEKVGVVTNAFHIKRTLWISKKHFKQPVTGIVASNSSFKNSFKPILREPFAFLKSLLFDNR